MTQELHATLGWFAKPSSQVSAHVVIAADGVLFVVVPDELVAWHATRANTEHLGAELVQCREGEPFTDEQYRTLAWWVRSMRWKYGFLLDRQHLIGHSEIDPQKSDPGRMLSFDRLLTEVRG